MAEHKKTWEKPRYSFTKEDQIFNWGQCEGKTIVEVMHKNAQYIEWCFKTVKQFKLGKKMQKIWDNLQEEKQ